MRSQSIASNTIQLQQVHVGSSLMHKKLKLQQVKHLQL